MKKLTVLILFIKFSISNAQIFGTQLMVEEENIKLKPWIEKNSKNYNGTYSYGESEAESSLHLSIFNNIVCAQLEQGSWVINKKNTGWHLVYRNFTNVKIEENYFYSDQSNGEFVTFNYGNKKHKGLKLYTPPVQMGDKDNYEIGTFSKPEIIGKYFNTKQEILSEKYLGNMSKSELKIMRNEIFARYHYIFSTKEMSNYFKNQEWYSGYHKNVDLYLTDIEKENIRRIQRFENNNR